VTGFSPVELAEAALVGVGEANEEQHDPLPLAPQGGEGAPLRETGEQHDPLLVTQLSLLAL
jgi:hypothetical protein